MELFISKKNRHGPQYSMLRLTRREAFLTMQSIANQLVENSANCGRFECFTKEGIDFSIAVMPDDTEEKYKKEIHEVHENYRNIIRNMNITEGARKMFVKGKRK